MTLVTPLIICVFSISVSCSLCSLWVGFPDLPSCFNFVCLSWTVHSHQSCDLPLCIMSENWEICFNDLNELLWHYNVPQCCYNSWNSVVMLVTNVITPFLLLMLVQQLLTVYQSFRCEFLTHLYISYAELTWRNLIMRQNGTGVPVNGKIKEPGQHQNLHCGKALHGKENGWGWIDIRACKEGSMGQIGID